MSLTEQLDRYMSIQKCKLTDVSRQSGVPYTTLDGFYKKGDDNVKLSTLKKLRTLLKCSLDELVGLDSGSGSFSIEETLLLSKFRQLDEDNRKALLLSIDVLIASQKQKRKDTSA